MPTRLQLNFAAAWLARDTDRLLCAAAGLISQSGHCYLSIPGQPGHDPESPSVGDYHLSPAGRDLLATIDALDIDPATARADDDIEPIVAQVCSTCDGSREVTIIGSFKNPCPDCAHEIVITDECARVRGLSLTDFAREIIQTDVPWYARDPIVYDSPRYINPLTGRMSERGPERQHYPQPRGLGKTFTALLPTPSQIAERVAERARLAPLPTPEPDLSLAPVVYDTGRTSSRRGPAIQDLPRTHGLTKPPAHKPDLDPPGFGED